MSNDNNFIPGLIVKAPNERAPEYVKAKLSIKRAELLAYLQGQDGEWINADVKVSQQGKWYCAIDTWRPNSDRQESSAPRQQRDELRGNNPPHDALGRDQTPDFADDSIPF